MIVIDLRIDAAPVAYDLVLVALDIFAVDAEAGFTARIVRTVAVGLTGYLSQTSLIAAARQGNGNKYRHRQNGHGVGK